MQSFNDLNNYSNTPVNYGTSANYVITFGTNSGNLSTTEFEGGYFVIYKQVPLNVFTDVSKDLLLTISTTTLNKIIKPFYNGSNSNINVWENSSQSWTITGIRSVANYNDVFANTYLGIVSGSTGTADITFLLDDQVATTQTYTATVTIVPNTLFSYTSPITFAEDTLSTFGNLLITDSVPQTTNYTLGLTPVDNALGKIKVVGGALSNTYSFTGTKTAVNNAIGNLRFAPGADSLTNTQINVLVTRTFDNKTVGQVIQANWDGTSHFNYSIPASYSTAEDTKIGLSNISITDIRPENIDANTQYSITVNSTNSNQILLEYGNTYSTSVTLTGTKSSLNTLLANANARPNVIPFSDFVGTGGITYTQVNTTDNVNQATAILIPVDVSDAPDYSITTNYVMPVTNSDPAARFTYQVLDQDAFANTYTLTFTQNSGNVGNFIVNGSSSGSGPLIYTANKSTVNGSNITFTTNFANVGNVGMAWDLSKTSTSNAVTQLASNVALTLSPAIANLKASYNYVSNRKNNIFANNLPRINTALTGNLSLTISTSSGYFGISDATASNNWVYIGSATAINNIFNNVGFWPSLGVSGNVTANIQVDSGSTTWVQRTMNLVGTAGNVSPGALGNVTLTNTTGYTPLLEQSLYCQADLLLIGGGGAGAYGGGGGGAGGVTEVANVIFPTGTQAVSIGAGGTTRLEFTYLDAGIGYRNGNGNPGNSTQILTYSSGGGLGGIRSMNSNGTLRAPNGGNSGSPQSLSGGTGTSGTISGTRLFSGGGGGGAGTIGVGPTGSASGAGGNGIASSTTVVGTYSAGGGGGSSNLPRGISGTSTAIYGNGGRGTGWFSGNPAPEAGQRGVVIIEWKPR